MNADEVARAREVDAYYTALDALMHETIAAMRHRAALPPPPPWADVEGYLARSLGLEGSSLRRTCL
jgi:hypothetical protein